MLEMATRSGTGSGPATANAKREGEAAFGARFAGSRRTGDDCPHKPRDHDKTTRYARSETNTLR